MTKELDLLRRYLDSAPEPAQADLDTSRQRLRSAIDLEARTALSEEAGTPAPSIRIKRSQSRRSYLAVAALAAALLVVVAIVVPIVFQTSTKANRGSASGHPGAASLRWKLVASITQPAWQVQPSVTPNPNSLTCPTATSCYAAGPSTAPGSPGYLIVEVSHDGGTTWQQSPVPTGMSYLFAATCPGENTCMVGVMDSSGRSLLLTTTDGGKNWTSLPMPSSTLLACASASTCVATGSKPGPGGLGAKFVAYVTDDGGRSWSESALPGTFRPSALQCFSNRRCVATGQAPSAYRVTNPDQFRGAAAVIYSSDGGSTWNAGAVPARGSSIGGLSCADAEHCMAVETENYGTAGEPPTVSSVVLLTDDGGEGWTPSASAPPSTGLLDLQSVSCVTSVQCWVSGAELAPGTTNWANSQAVVLATQDGGAIWQNDQLPTVPGVALRSVGSIACPTLSGCFALAYQPSSSARIGQQLVLSNQPPPERTRNRS